MPTPDFEKYGYEPEADSMNYLSYVNKNWEYGYPYRIGAAPNGEGGWGVSIDWKPGSKHDPDQQTTFYEEVEGTGGPEAASQRETRFDAAMVIERAMKEHAPRNYGPQRSGSDGDFMF